MTELWLLEDLEPFPDRPAVGDDVAPETFWLDAGSEIYESAVLSEICTRVAARVEPRRHGEHTEWVADLGSGFNAVLPGEHALRLVDGSAVLDDHDVQLRALRNQLPPDL